jgi:hypothetical protein
LTRRAGGLLVPRADLAVSTAAESKSIPIFSRAGRFNRMIAAPPKNGSI